MPDPRVLRPTFAQATEHEQIAYAFGFELPASLDVPVSWGESASQLSLDNDDMGQWVVVSYSIEAFQ